MELCAICNKQADLNKDHQALCAPHYVELSDPDALYWDLHALLKEDMVGTNKQAPRRLLEAIKKRHPHLVHRYYLSQSTKKSAAQRAILAEELNPATTLAMAHEKAKQQQTEMIRDILKDSTSVKE